ncbi:MAG: two-CW domain-containing protein [Candidatus Kariarchaeaceae archaeon]|jgi:hypothetical protein
MDVRNCWEYIKCGKGLGSDDECISAKYQTADGYLTGKNGGRACMFITTTKCQSEESLYNPKKYVEVCAKCDFYAEIEESYGPLQFFDFLDYIYEQSRKEMF